MPLTQAEGLIPPMPKYECHKVVHALKIKSIEFDIDLANRDDRETDGSAMLTFESDKFPSIRVDHAYVMGIKPRNDKDDKGYYVVYKDGYKSWSPTKVFEEGYKKVD